VADHEAAMRKCDGTDIPIYIYDDSDKESSHMQVIFLLYTVDLTLNTLRYYKNLLCIMLPKSAAAVKAMGK